MCSQPDWQTFDELLQWRAAEQGSQRLFTFLLDGESDERHITYGELDKRARAVAARLQSISEVGQRALLLYAPGLDYIIGLFGCLYAGVMAVPAYPPDPARIQRTLPRLQAIATDADAACILTTKPLFQLAQLLLSQAPDLAARTWVLSDELENELADHWQPLAPDGARAALLQYTSGSTSSPKGVVLTHSNLLHNSGWITAMMEVQDDSQGVIWLPPYHDMGLIGGILQPVYRGFPCTLFSPVDFLKKPIRWLRAISRFGGTISGGPNFAFDLCARKFDPARDAETLDLSSWRVAFNGAEPVRADTLQRFTETFSSYGFRHEAFWPCYGLAEGTLIATGVTVAEQPTTLAIDRESLKRGDYVRTDPGRHSALYVGNGRSLGDQELVIADPVTKTLAADGKVGEIWIRGPSIAGGYWARPEETSASFGAYLADSGAGPFLRTGDLGFVHGDQLYVTGRSKDLIIIRGQNYYPQDIELVVERSHSALRQGCCAVVTVDMDGEEDLVVLVEANQRPDLNSAEVIDAVRQAVAEAHGLAARVVVLLTPRTIIKTSSGKIQRSACREAYLNGELSVVDQSTLPAARTAMPDQPAASPVEPLSAAASRQRRQLRALLRQRLAETVGPAAMELLPDQPLSAIGITSVQAVEISASLERDAGRELPATLVYDYPTLDALVAYLLPGVSAAIGGQVAAIGPDSPDALLADIESMSEEEAAAALLKELGGLM